MSRTFTAKYNGQCQRGCGGTVLKGQNAWYDRNGRFGHVLCPTSNKVEIVIEDTRCTECKARYEVDGHSMACSRGPMGWPSEEDGRDNVPEKMVPGVYKLADGRIYAVRTRKDKTGLYAMKMVSNTANRKMEDGSHAKIEFEYEYGIVLGFESKVIKLSDRMSVEEGKQLATLYGKCIACQRTLKATKSVEQGIGPVCITYFGPVFETKTAETVDGRDVVVAA